MKKFDNTIKNRTLVVFGCVVAFGLAGRYLLSRNAADGKPMMGKLAGMAVGGFIGLMASQGISSVVLKPKKAA